MMWVSRVVAVRQDPLVDGEQTSWLQDPADLTVDLRQVIGVASGLDGVGLVERIVLEGQIVEITLKEHAAIELCGHVQYVVQQVRPVTV